MVVIEQVYEKLIRTKTQMYLRQQFSKYSGQLILRSLQV